MGKSLHTRHSASSILKGVPFPGLSEEAQDNAITQVRNYLAENFLEDHDALEWWVDDFIQAQPYLDLDRDDITLIVDPYGPDSKCTIKSTMYDAEIKEFLEDKKLEMPMGELGSYNSLFKDYTPTGSSVGLGYTPLEFDYVSVEQKRWRSQVDEIRLAEFFLFIDVFYSSGGPLKDHLWGSKQLHFEFPIEEVCESHPEGGYRDPTDPFTFDYFDNTLTDYFFNNENPAAHSLPPEDFDINDVIIRVTGGATPLVRMIEKTIGLDVFEFLEKKYPVNTPKWSDRSRTEQKKLKREYRGQLFQLIQTFCTELDSFINFLLGTPTQEGFIEEQINESCSKLVSDSLSAFENYTNEDSAIEWIADMDPLFNTDGTISDFGG